jgi:alkylation response protein AidB-like acyl-CoA dehydrogenase
MDFDLSKPQKLLKETARQFLAREQSWQAIADQGWLDLRLPEELVEMAVVMEEMGRACAGGPFLSNIFAAALIRAAGSPEQQERWLPAIAAGETKATVAILEESARSLFVPDADVADLILGVRRQSRRLQSGADAPHSEVCAFVASPVSITPMPSMDESRRLFEVTLEPGEPLPGDREAVQRAIDVATVALCAEMVGGMQWILDTSVEYAKTRQQFGRAIGSFQAVQHQCADMLLLTESARSAMYFAAFQPTPLAVSIAKAYCSDAYREVANRGVQVHGGIGFTWEHRLQLYYKRSKSSETTFGDATFHRERIASLVVDEVSVDVQKTRRGSDGVHDSGSHRTTAASVHTDRVVRTGTSHGG